MLSQVTVSAGVTPGLVQGFRYRAVNRQGGGPWSDTGYFRAANVPSQILGVQTQLQGTDVKIQWQEPSSGSEPILFYRIEVLSSDGIFREVMECDGSDAYIMQNLFCLVPMSVFTSDPLAIAQEALIQVRVSAMNVLGSSVPSILNTEGVQALYAP
jgi:hypothetical protein